MVAALLYPTFLHLWIFLYSRLYDNSINTNFSYFAFLCLVACFRYMFLGFTYCCCCFYASFLLSKISATQPFKEKSKYARNFEIPLRKPTLGAPSKKERCITCAVRSVLLCYSTIRQIPLFLFFHLITNFIFLGKLYWKLWRRSVLFSFCAASCYALFPYVLEFISSSFLATISGFSWCNIWFSEWNEKSHVLFEHFYVFWCCLFLISAYWV